MEKEPDRVHDFLSGGGEMGELIRKIDWSQTPVGCVDQWPQSLRTAISIMLNTHFPMYVAWGPDFTQFYNDGYRPILGATKHPAAMGLSTRITFSEIWDIIGPMFEGVMQGKAVGVTDFLLPLDRYGFTEECYFIFSYSPIKQENGQTGGVLVTVTETTNRVFSERRLKALHDLGNRSSSSKTLDAAAESILDVLGQSRYDVPFSALYLHDDKSSSYKLFGSTGLLSNATEFPSAKGVTMLADDQGTTDVSKIFSRIAFDDALPWPELPSKAYITRLSRSDQNAPFGYLILGVSGRLQFNDHYNKFFKLFTDQCIATLTSANAFEEERNRVEALAEIDRAKTVFFNNISHEFRTPLTLMLGPVEDVLKNDNNSKETRELVTLVHRNGLRLQKLVNNLLEFSRLEAGRLEVSYLPVNLSRLTADLASSFLSAMDKAGLRLKVDCAEIGELVFVDPDMWEKIVLNLISNAFKHTFEGSISITTKRVDSHVHVIVQDTGVGIPPDQLPNLFKRFHRVPNARSRTHEGSGIGLAMVNELVKLHCGSIHVESEVDKGTTFTVMLPTGNAHLPQDRIRVDDIPRSRTDWRSYVEETMRWLPGDGGKSQGEVETSKVQFDASSSFDGRKPLVILADDNPDMRAYVKNILSPYCRIHDVSNGRAALDATKAMDPDLVLSDVMMPEFDGFELVKRLRSDASLNAIPVILLSARAGEESKVEGLTDGADDYLVKPFSSRELIARVRTNLKMSLTRKQAQQAIMDSEARLRAIVETTPECIKIVSPKGLVQYMNKVGLYMVEATTSTFNDARILDVIAPEHRERWVEMHARVCGGESLSWEFDIVGLSGTRRSLETHAAPLPQGDGTFSQLAVTRDVTDRKKAENALKRNQIILKGQRRALEQAVHGEALSVVLATIIKTVEDQSPVPCNASMLLVDHGDAHGKPTRNYHRIIRSERVEANAELSSRAPMAKEEVVVEDLNGVATLLADHEGWNQLGNDAKAYWSTPVLSSSNELLATIAVYYPSVRAPTEEDRNAVGLLAQTTGIVIEWYEEILQRKILMTELEQRVEERTRQLHNVNVALKQSNNDLQQFAHVASHDLKEPVRKIKTFANRLKDEASSSLSDKASSYLEKVLSSAERMSLMIDGVLAYSTLSASPAQQEFVDLNTILHDIKNDLEVMIQQTDAEIRNDSLPVIRGSRFLLYQLFYNLINNALKFSKPDVKPVVTLTSAIDNTNKGVTIVVSDNGIGFDGIHARRIFDTFTRLHSKDKFEGTGLGLSLCRKIVQRHGGTIDAYGKCGEGASFIIKLPSRSDLASESNTSP